MKTTDVEYRGEGSNKWGDFQGKTHWTCGQLDLEDKKEGKISKTFKVFNLVNLEDIIVRDGERQFGRKVISSFFKNSTLLMYNLYSIKFTHVKHTG